MTPGYYFIGPDGRREYLGADRRDAEEWLIETFGLGTMLEDVFFNYAHGYEGADKVLHILRGVNPAVYSIVADEIAGRYIGMVLDEGEWERGHFIHRGEMFVMYPVKTPQVVSYAQMMDYLGDDYLDGVRRDIGESVTSADGLLRFTRVKGRKPKAHGWFGRR
ncbi:MAG: hypothetical protein Q4P84_08615 [Elusimicrobiales bacterium]|nr:hypothetical protein [Elusimicrobiales bacterium]